MARNRACCRSRKRKRCRVRSDSAVKQNRKSKDLRFFCFQTAFLGERPSERNGWLFCMKTWFLQVAEPVVAVWGSFSYKKVEFSESDTWLESKKTVKYDMLLFGITYLPNINDIFIAKFPYLFLIHMIWFYFIWIESCDKPSFSTNFIQYF